VRDRASASSGIRLVQRWILHLARQCVGIPTDIRGVKGVEFRYREDNGEEALEEERGKI
jgi:hypothetical protein